MEEQKNEFIQWVKTNRKKLIFAGISIVTIIGIIVTIRNKDKIRDLWESLRMSIENSTTKVPTFSHEVAENVIYTTQINESVTDTKTIQFSPSSKNQIPFDVSEHIRKLPYGHNPSEKKMRTAESKGIDLKSGQTLVDKYTKGASVA